MIEIENDVFSTVATALRTAHEGVFVSSEYVNAPPHFPAVSIIENGNSVVTRYRTLNIENAARVMFECNIYSDKPAGAKEEAKAVCATLDTAFAGIGFTRVSRNQVTNFNDTRIYRIVCRYEAIVDKDLWIYHN